MDRGRRRQGHVNRLPGRIWFGVVMAALVMACTSTPTGPAPGSAVVAASPSAATVSRPTPTVASSPPATAAASQRPALVGQWELDRTCQAIVTALTKAGHPELIRQDVGELVQGNVDGNVPANWDVKRPCADALPPTPHSHTFWPNGQFNSYDENGNEVDDGPWAIVDDHTFSIGGSTFTYAIAGDELRFEPIVPNPCTGKCAKAIWWMYSVSFPGSAWRRLTSGPHVP